MKKKKSSKIDESIVNVLARYEYLTRAMETLHTLSSGIQRPRYYGEDKSLVEAFGRIYSEIHKQKCETLRYIFMFGLVNEETQKRAKALAYRDMLRDNYSVMYLMEPDLTTPSSWMSKDEEGFRQELTEAFGEGWEEELKRKK